MEKMELNEIKILPYHLIKELKNPPVWTEEEKKLIAWSICWEGCISLTKRKYKNKTQRLQLKPYIGITNTNFKLLQTFQNIFRLGTITEKKTSYQLKIRTFEECLYLLSNIYDFLPAKQEQALYTILFIKSRLSHKKGRIVSYPYTQVEIEYQEKVHNLNQKRGKKK
jgi:hypothetical protein